VTKQSRKRDDSRRKAAASMRNPWSARRAKDAK
jgi:hypothetical protein